MVYNGFILFYNWEIKWGKSDATHPFWFIRRAPAGSEPAPNMKLVTEKVTYVAAVEGKLLKCLKQSALYYVVICRVL